MPFSVAHTNSTTEYIIKISQCNGVQGGIICKSRKTELSFLYVTCQVSSKYLKDNWSYGAFKKATTRDNWKVKNSFCLLPKEK